MLIVSFKEYLSQFPKNYLYSNSRRVEFIFCIIAQISLLIIVANTPLEDRTFLGMMQGFVSVYLAFRFGIIGMLISIILSLKDGFSIIIFYLYSRNQSLLAGFAFTTLTIAYVLVVGTISSKQDKHRREMQRIAITDDLTNVFNQRFLHSTLDAQIKSFSKTGNSIGLILIDIDNFKMFNDLYGLNFGDEILKNTASMLKKVVDKDDSIYRFGGDEFAILTLNISSKELEIKAKKIYQNFEKIKNEDCNSQLKKITFSVGFSEYPSTSTNKEELISHANMALYQAKNLGDDKVHFYQNIMHSIKKDMMSDQQMIGVFNGILSTIVTKDKYTFGHCERVSSYAVMIGEAMGLELKEIQTIKQAGLLHDIGKIELPKSILNKIGRLTDEEFELIRQHPIHGANILEPLSGMDNLVDYVRHHHERYDGKGYPDGIIEENISLGARIICVADCFDAMVSDRPYRKGMSVQEAFKEIEKCSGSQFDPRIAKLFINAMKNHMSIKYNYNVEDDDSLGKESTFQMYNL